MRPSKILIMVVLCWASFSFLFLWGKDQNSITLEEVLSIGCLDDDILYMWAGITTDLKGNIYVTDTMDYSIKKFNDKGILLKKAGRKGQGPGEFLTPRLIKYFKGLIYVTDQFIPGIKVFDENLNYKYQIPLRIPVIDLKIISNERIFVSGIFLLEKKSIMIIDSKGNIKSDFKYLERSKEYWRNVVKFDIDNGRNLYVIFSFEDKIQKFDKNGKKLWTRNLLEKKKVKKKKLEKVKYGFSEVPIEIVYKDITIDSSGNLFILGGHLSESPGRDVYVIDKNGKYLTTFTLPEPSHCIHIDDHNFLYSRAGMGITIKKYSLKYN